jgi:hypothetical protein
MSDGTNLFHRQLGEVHHYGYVVDSIEATVARLVEQLGAGPFFAVDGVPVENVTSRGEPATFVHNSAFGYVGGNAVEFMEIGDTSPERAGAGFAGARPYLHHLGWVIAPDRVEGVRKELDDRGMPEYLHAHMHAIDFTYHDGSATLGHDIEIHADVEDLHGFFARFKEAAEGWDGTDPIRPAMG